MYFDESKLQWFKRIFSSGINTKKCSSQSNSKWNWNELNQPNDSNEIN